MEIPTHGGYIKFFRLGKRVSFFVYFNLDSGFALTDGQKIAIFSDGIPDDFKPDPFFYETEHTVMNRNSSQIENARLVIRSTGIYVYGVNFKTHYELKGTIHYITK